MDTGSRMNILHVTTFLQGGAGRAICELACAQHQAGHQVTVVASKTGEGDYCNYPLWVDRLASAGVPLLQVDSTFKRDLALNIAAFKAMREGVNWNHLTIVHAHAAVPSMLSLLLTSRAPRRIPVLQTMHGWGIAKNAGQATTDITLMNALDCIVAVSSASRHRLVDLGVDARLLTLVPYGVEPAPPVDSGPIPEPLRRWKATNLRVLVCVGSVGQRKNQRLLIAALVSGDAPGNIACAFIGEGGEIPALSAMVRECGLSSRICFLGYQSESFRHLSAADWLILPSRDEGMPLSILEAYRSAVPVLGSDIDEIAEVVIPGQTGLLFRSQDRDSLVSMLQGAATMAEERRLALGEAGRRLWLDRYTLETMQANYEAVYQRLIAGNRNEP